MVNNRILLVEDNQHDVELFIEAFEAYSLNTSVTVLRDGAEALDYLYRRGTYKGCVDESPILILLDLKMPKVDGLQVLENIKADLELRRIPVVMMTSSREQSDLMRSYNLGVNSYIVKPVQFKDFLEAVRQLGAYWTSINEPPHFGEQKGDR